MKPKKVLFDCKMLTSNGEQHSSAHAKCVNAKVTKFILRQSFKQFQVDFMFHKKFYRKRVNFLKEILIF